MIKLLLLESCIINIQNVEGEREMGDNFYNDEKSKLFNLRMN
jgi:hypothetical protein